MYNLKRILDSIVDATDMATGPLSLRESCDKARRLAAEALIEVAVLEKQQTEAPQEMRDFFAGAALVGLLSGTQRQNPTVWTWDISDAMMSERAKRIEQRRAANPPDSIGE